MLTVDQYDYVRTAFRVYGKTIRAIARETGHSRNTIKKVLNQEYKGYKSRDKQHYPVLEPYLNTIDKWLTNDKNQPRKQRHTAVRVFNRLCQEHGFAGSETTVRKYVREAKVRLGVNACCAFIPSDPEIGLEAEVDWGTCIAIIDDIETRLKFFCMRSKYSAKHFVRCYPCERQQAFFDAHIHAVSFFGGVFSTLIYDNLTTAVQKVLKGKDRRLQQSYDKFKAYYNFEARFCNPGKAHEKGGVEGLVGYARRNYLVPVPVAESLEALNEKLLRDCLAYGDHRVAGKESTVNELFDAEKEKLIALPGHVFSNLETYDGKADKYATVAIDKNRYSVPYSYAGYKLRSIVYVDRIEIFYGNLKIADHDRLYGNNKWSLHPEHYLKLIEMRPMSFESARPIRQWRKKWPSCFEKIFNKFKQKQGPSKGTREFISVLMLYKEHGDSVVEAVEKALSANVSTSQAVEHILLNLNKESTFNIEALENWDTLPAPDVSVYQQIGGVL